MKEDIESLINAELDMVESDKDEEIIKAIEEKISKQNIEVENKAKRREIIKSFLKANNITSIDELSDEQIMNILKYKI